MSTTAVHLLPQGLAARLAVAAIAASAVYGVSIALYRLFFSPLSQFPGPKMAAVTGYYEFYHDFFRNGKYIFEIEKMHARYGPIVRVNPHELSIHDSEFYNEIYVTGSVRRTNNYSHFGQGIDFEGSHFLTTDHDLHRQRRKPLEPFFSRQGVMKLEPMIAETVARVNSRLEALKGTDVVVRLDHVSSAFSGDVIAQVCCEEYSELLGDPEFSPQWFDLFQSIVRSTPLFMGFPFLITIVSLVPEKFLAWVDSPSKPLVKWKKMAAQHIIEAKRDKTNAKPHGTTSRPSLFHQIVHSDMPESELSAERLVKEAQLLLGAGTASMARTLDFIIFYILAKPDIHARLQDELRDTMAEYPQRKPSWAELERLPYLQAIIKEGLRLSYGIMRRLPRCSPDVAIQYKQWTIPRNVPVGMSAYLMHTDPRVFPNPFAFDPDRWLSAADAAMRRNLVPFCRGSRNCLGMNLAYAELNMTVATLMRPAGPRLRLFQTDESNIVPAHDFLIPLPKLDTKGVRVTVA